MMDEELRVESRAAGDAVVLDIIGDVTTTAEAAILAAYEEQAAAGARKFVLNFTRVEYVNSSGIAIVIHLLTRMRRQDQRLSIFGLNRHFQKMFHIVGVDRYSKMCETEAEALACL
jgi:anti-anti-sigma factor